MAVLRWPMPTPLEQLIQQQVAASLVNTISRTTDRIAEEMAQEILKDPVWRAHVQDLIRRAFDQTVTNLSAPSSDTPSS